MFNIKFRKIALTTKFQSLFKKQVKEKNKKSFILFPDAAAGKEKIDDFFNRDRVAQEIASAINNSEGQMNFLISGEWGIGKTSILNLIESKIKGKIKFIWFSPWKYSGTKQEAGPISRVFLTTLANNLEKKHIVNDLYIKKTVESERNLGTQIIMLVQLIIVYSLYLSIIFFIFSKIGPILFQYVPLLNKIADILGETGTVGIIASILALPPLGQYFFSRIREQGEMEQISSPELFEIKFHSLVEETVKYKSLQRALSFMEETFSKTWLFFLGKPFTNLIYKIRTLKLNKLIIFVDDLDRCGDMEVNEFLSGMKTFFEHPQVYYVIAADMNRLKENFKSNDKEALRKIIQLDWNVPSLRKNEVKDYVNALLDISGAKKEFSTPKEYEELYSMLQLHPIPRKIKYYLRRLLFQMNLESI